MRTDLRKANGGWFGIASAVLFFVSTALVSPPGADSPAAEISVFYADNRGAVFLAQTLSLLAVVFFLAFTLRFAFAATPGPRDPDKWRFLWASGVLVFAATVVTALPILALAITSEANAAGTATRPLAQLADVADGALFLTISLFLIATATRGTRAPSWLRAAAAVTALVALGRAAGGLLPITTPFDTAAPLLFIAVVALAGIWMLRPPPQQHA